jgi:hypothetical protein
MDIMKFTDWTNGAQNWSRILCEWMQCKSIYNQQHEVYNSLVRFVSSAVMNYRLNLVSSVPQRECQREPLWPRCSLTAS